MSINDVGMLFSFIGGLGMFLYGMNIMADGLQKSAGGRMQKLMSFLTKNRLMAILVGAGITAIIQSSSATTVMVVGFVNAGMLELTQAVGVIMGANIGTTITAWIVSMSEWGSVMKPEFFAPLLLGIGAFLVLFTKGEKKKKIGEILVGFSILFIGLSFMSDAIKPYRDAPVFAKAFAVLGKNPVLAILAGAGVTAVIQSSSASVGILQTLALNGVVNWQSAVFITLGQNIGTCVTALISSAGAGKNAKRASIIHLLFNVIGAVVFGIIMFILFSFNKAWGASTINSVEISIFHTIFNVLNTLMLIPFADKLVRLSTYIIRDNKADEQPEISAAGEMRRHLDERILGNSTFAMDAVLGEVNVMGQYTLENLKRALEGIETGNKDTIRSVFQNEKIINEMEKIMTSFLVQVDNLSLTEEQHQVIKNLFYTVSDLERVGDHAENIAELADNMRKDEVTFSKKGFKDMKLIAEETILALESALKAREFSSASEAMQEADYERNVDKLEDELREKHIQRLSKGKCVPESGVVFLDLISNLERIADHATNIAGYVVSEAGKGLPALDEE
ncbi:Na/Pi cotransporter family protein [Eisenbergiella tayi]|uniref:Na/Pi cotransporter family protein n=1 Tax=Eisenbergiella tayi TaxID=1432052 RepID=UPI000213468E|nr:Na/Pi cotransporter family protein [Eisenbergiella tayi]EGN42010.1 phosphate:Na+ symporter [Lachnospiraceae bacterium 3_1_57FAA_CT1]